MGGGAERIVSAEITDLDRKLAKQCEACPACRRARRKQGGVVFWFVKVLEGGVCPACRAFEKVHGRKAHEPVEGTF